MQSFKSQMLSICLNKSGINDKISTLENQKEEITGRFGELEQETFVVEYLKESGEKHLEERAQKKLDAVNEKLASIENQIKELKQSNNDPPRFLRWFASHMKDVMSFARFPYSQLNTFKEIVKELGFYTTNRIGSCELDGLFCFEMNNNWYSIRRFNGEDHWNITTIGSHCRSDPSSEEIKLFIEELQKHDELTLVVPKTDLEYIPPQEYIKSFVEDDVEGWCETSSFTIKECQRRELKSYESHKLDEDQTVHYWLSR